ncbi:trypsin-1 [Folsomia candida]|uniref:trypsin-1 n=1 Tax=Folsomia candida TaxID=158441 RepID=UPI000B8F62E0|nr:trypsin-1 [Folsomia candida]
MKNIILLVFASTISNLIFNAECVPLNENNEDPPQQQVDPFANMTIGVVGGKPAESLDKYPHQIALLHKDKFFCGGSIYSETCILTAAHCTEYDDGSLIPADVMSVRAGSLKHNSGGQVYKVGKVIRNPGYNREASFDGDIAILQLTSTIWFGFGKTSASLSYKEPEAGTTHVVTGWGRTSETGKDSDVLQYANVPIVSRSECQKAYPDEKITDNMICGGYPEGGKDSCKGDSGGPLTRQWSNIQAGITSWGYGCARPGQPGVYTNTAKYVDWVKSYCSK